MNNDENFIEEETKINLIDLFYEVSKAIVSDYKKYLAPYFLFFILGVINLIYASTTDDVVKIVSTLVLGVLSMFLTVYVCNVYASQFTNVKLSFQKVLWDIPTYFFYELGFGMLFLMGCIFLILPGIYIWIFYSIVPIVAICFDHFDFKERGVFSLSKRIVDQNVFLYIQILVIGFFLTLIDQGIEQIYLLTGSNLVLGAGLNLFSALFDLLSLGLVIKFISFYIHKVDHEN